MANIMTKRGNQDNVATYEHFCDTAADMNNIEPRHITLGSVCIVLEGESGNLDIYIANSEKKWVNISGGESISTVQDGDDDVVDMDDEF